jgi:hypothetical protein
MWFAGPLRSYYANPNAGFVILLIAFPILERYLREKSNVNEGSLNSLFYTELRNLFPALTSEQEKDFYHVYRNGLLHQVSPSRQRQGTSITLQPGWLSSGGADLEVKADGFWVHPRLFAEKILGTIEGDFSTFEGQNSPAHPLPVVTQLTPTNGTSSYSPPATGIAPQALPRQIP